MITSQRHAVSCRCILSQNKSSKSPKTFMFLVCSLLRDGVVDVSYAECPNCGITHRVTDICKSEIIPRSELTGAMQTIEEIKLSMPERLVTLLSGYELDVSTWQHARNIIDHELWGGFVILKRERVGSEEVVKFLRIFSSTLFKIETTYAKSTV